MRSAPHVPLQFAVPHVPLLLAAACAAACATSGPVARVPGSRAMEVILEADGGDGATDGPRIARRLEEMGADAWVRDARDGRVAVVVEDPRDLARLRLAARPGRLGFHLVDETTGLPEPDARLTGGDVEEARVGRDEAAAPHVEIRLTPGASARFADLTGASVGRKLAIVLDGEVQSAPVIMERIEGPDLRLTTGGGPDAGARAEAFAAALSAGPPLSRHWHVRTVLPASP
jgi:preprotein translocase subunit SecD